MYLRFKYKDIEVELTPETIKDIRQQLVPQIKQMPYAELMETIEAAGLPTRTVIDFFGKRGRAGVN